MPEILSEPQRWVIPAVLIVSVAVVLWTLWRERSKPAASAHRPRALADWQAMPAAAQEAHDNAVLDAAQAAEDAVRRAVDEQLSEELAEAAKRNALFHP